MEARTSDRYSARNHRLLQAQQHEATGKTTISPNELHSTCGCVSIQWRTLQSEERWRDKFSIPKTHFWSSLLAWNLPYLIIDLWSFSSKWTWAIVDFWLTRPLNSSKMVRYCTVSRSMSTLPNQFPTHSPHFLISNHMEGNSEIRLSSLALLFGNRFYFFRTCAGREEIRQMHYSSVRRFERQCE